MIQVYAPNNTNFANNGVALMPYSCLLSMEINGSWTVQIENGLDDRFQNIVENSILKVPTPYREQLFRITQIEINDTGVSAIALPVFLDAKNEVFIYDQRPTDKNGQQALDILTNRTKYKGHSNITKVNTAYYQMKNLIECISSDDDNSFLKRWGGEIRYSDYEIYINDRLGSDNGARVEFGFNLNSIQESIDMSNVVTKIIPVAYNGYTLPQGETVDSPNLNKYPTPFIRVINYENIKLSSDAQEDDEENGVIVCDTIEELQDALRDASKKEFENGIDIPSITYQVDMVDLAKTQEYSMFKDLVAVNLGDTVHVKHRRLGIETEARIIALEYDCISQKITNLTIGDYVENYFDKNTDITSSAEKVIDTGNNTLMADKIAGVINLLNTSLRAQKDIAQKQDVRAILFEDLDTNSPTFGALCIGTQGIQISKQRNETNADWVWGTAINFESIIADYIITGILSDKLGKFYLNLDTGELRMKDGTFTGSITGGTINGSEISTDKDLVVGNNIKLNVENTNVYKSIEFSKNSKIFTNKDEDGTISVTIVSDDISILPRKNFTIYAGNGNQISMLNSSFTLSTGGKSILWINKDQTIIEADTLIGSYVSGQQKNLTVTGDLIVRGQKNRVVDTKYGKVKMNAVESTYALFEDFGVSKTNDKGISIIKIDKLFKETVSVDNEYFVLLQEYGEGHLFVVNRNKDSFIVKGTPNLKFGWRITAKQKGYENIRMEVIK